MSFVTEREIIVHDTTEDIIVVRDTIFILPSLFFPLQRTLVVLKEQIDVCSAKLVLEHQTGRFVRYLPDRT